MIKVILAVLMILITLFSASAVTLTDVNLDDDFSTDSIRKLNSFVTVGSDFFGLLFVNYAGGESSISTTGAGDLAKLYGVKPYNDDFSLWVVTEDLPVSRRLCKNNYNNFSQSCTVLGSPLNQSQNISLVAYLPDSQGRGVYFFVNRTSPLSQWFLTRDLATNHNSDYTLTSDIVPSYHYNYTYLYPPFISYNGSWIINDLHISNFGLVSQEMFWYQFVWNGTSLYRVGALSRTGSGWSDPSNFDSNLFVAEDTQNNTFVIRGKNTSYLYCNPNTLFCLEDQSNFIRGDSINWADLYYVSGTVNPYFARPYELFINSSGDGSVYRYDRFFDTNITPYNGLVGWSPDASSFMGESLVIKKNSSQYVFVSNEDEFVETKLGELKLCEQQGYTSLSELACTSLFVVDNDYSVVLTSGRSNIYLLNTTDNSNITILQNLSLVVNQSGFAQNYLRGFFDGEEFVHASFPDNFGGESYFFYDFLDENNFSSVNYYDDDSSFVITSFSPLVAYYQDLSGNYGSWSKASNFSDSTFPNGSGTGVRHLNNYYYYNPNNLFYFIGWDDGNMILSAVNGSFQSSFTTGQSFYGAGIGDFYIATKQRVYNFDKYDGFAPNDINNVSVPIAVYNVSQVLVFDSYNDLTPSVYDAGSNIADIRWFDSDTLLVSYSDKVHFVDYFNGVFSLDYTFDPSCGGRVFFPVGDYPSDGLLHIICRDDYEIWNLEGFGYTNPENTTDPDACGDGVCGYFEDSFICPVDCGGAVCGNSICEAGEDNLTCPSDCPTYFYYDPVPTSDPENFSTENDLVSLKVYDDLLIAGDWAGSDEVRKYNFSFSLLTSGVLLDFDYDVDRSGDSVFVGTDDEINIFSGYNSDNFSLVSTDGWGGLFHPDRAEDYVALNSTAGFVCDNNDEPDYHIVGSDPTGNVGGGCYDMELGEALFVDIDSDGFAVYNVTDLSLITSFDHRSLSHGLSSGDLSDLSGDLYVSKKNNYDFEVFNISNVASPVNISRCSNAGVGEVISVELISDSLAVGGTSNGYLVVCNFTDTDVESNTDWYYLDDLDGEPLRFLEFDGNSTLYILTPLEVQPYELNLTGVSTNSAPNISNYTVSDTSPYLNQTVDVQLFAGNVEPEDVIRYGIKCYGNESDYFWNTNGQFECVYYESGTFNMKLAVTDNFHVGSWFDVRNVVMQVSNTSFVGGLLRVQVIDEDSLAVEDAVVTTGNQSFNTSEYGFVTFTLPTSGLYSVVTEKDGYYSEYDDFYANGLINVVELTSVAGVGDTALVVTVVDSNGAFVNGALVSYTNTITYQYDWKFTNAQGRVVFLNADIGSVVVQASKSGFDSSSQVVNIAGNTTTSVTLTVSGEFNGTGVLRIDRDCVDDGIWLCGDVDVQCSSDGDCLSDHCSAVGRCSRFNYSVCDEQGKARDQRCVYEVTAKSYMTKITNWILGNLLWVIVLLIIIIAVVILASIGRK